MKKSFITFNDAGRFLFKTKNVYFLLTAGHKGQGGKGGHAHNDVLSYELNIDDKDLIIDPGTYNYTANPEERNNFRSVKSHNTLCWGEIEPCSLNKGLFSLPEEGLLTIDTKTDSDTNFTVNGLYRFKDRYHNRIVQIDKTKRTIKIVDKCSHQKAYINLILAPTVNVKSELKGVWLNNIWIEFNGISRIKESVAYYSPEYGIKIPTKQLHLYLDDLESTHVIHF